MIFRKQALFVLLALPIQVFAQSIEGVAPVSVSEQNPSSENSILSKIQSDSSHTYYGPAITHPGIRKSADSAKNTYQPLYIRNQISLGYLVAEKTTFSGTADFDYWMSDAQFRPENEGFHWRDCFLKLKRNDLASTTIGGNDLTVDSDFRYYMPTSKFSRQVDSYGSLRLSINPSLQFQDSRWSLSSTNYVRYYMNKYQDAPTEKGFPENMALNSVLFYTSIQINHAFSDRVTGFLLVEANDMFDTHGTPSTQDTNASLVDLQPGVSIGLGDRVVLTPALNWFTNQSLDTTSFVLTADIKLY